MSADQPPSPEDRNAQIIERLIQPLLGFFHQDDAEISAEKIMNRNPNVQDAHIERIEAEVGRILQLNVQDRYKHQFIEHLYDVLADNRLATPGDTSMHDDRVEIAGYVDINVDNTFICCEHTYISYLEGQYRPSPIRKAALRKLADLGMQNEKEMCVQKYFCGCMPQEVEMPSEQDADEVLAVLNDDLNHVSTLPMPEGTIRETRRSIVLGFLDGKHPIDTNQPIGLSDPIMEHTRALTERRDRLLPQAISLQMERYRRDIARGLDYDEQQAMRQEEGETSEKAFSQDLERRKKDYAIEIQFLQSLELPEFEGKHWPKDLLHTANSSYFNINPSFRERAHEHVCWFVDLHNKHPQGDDKWFVCGILLQNFYNGQYYPDDARWMVLRNECSRINENEELSDTQKFLHQVDLHDQFVKGSQKDAARMNTLQDSIDIQRAYTRDMALFDTLDMDSRLVDRARQEYKNHVLLGDIAYTVDREQDADRETLRQSLHQLDPEKEYVDDISIVFTFIDYWREINARAAPRN